jgi:NADPH:quinone reductase-like Zn-dependent oxidoreductase
VQLAANIGTEVTGVCSTANVNMVRDLGARHVIDYTQTDYTKSGDTYDVIFDTVGKSSFGKSRASLTKNGIFITTVPDPATSFSPLFRVFTGGKRAKMSATGLRKDADKSRTWIS